MHSISSRLASLSLSETLAMTQMSRELIHQGIDVINLSIGEPDFNTPEPIKKAAIQAIEDNYTHYPPVPGYLDLREAIANKLHRENGLSYSPQDIVVSNGAKQSIANALFCLVNPGDEVIIPAPYWVSYPEMVKLAEGKPVFLQASLENNHKITSEQLESAITSKTRALLYSSPSNPSGQIYTQKELADLSAVLEKHPDVMVISDEIYEHINYVDKHCSIAQVDGMKERTALINGFSKSYAMTGWRLGYLAGPEWLAKACTKLQGQYTSGACTISQKAAIQALQGDQRVVSEMVEVFKTRRNLIVNRLSQIKSIRANCPQGAFYVLPDISSYFGKKYDKREIGSSGDLAMYLLNEAHVGLVSGSAFGAPDCIRISYATSTDILEKGLDRIETALGNLQ